MPSIDLAGVKTQLTSSLSSLSSLANTFNKLGSGISELKSLGDALPTLTRTLDRAISGIGTSITGATTAALPKMQSMVENLIPSTADVQDLCSSAINKIDTGRIPDVPGLKPNLVQISDESKKVETTSKSVSTQMKAENQPAEDGYKVLISEIDGLANTLGNYSSQVGAYLFNPSGNTMPHFSQLADSLKMDQLQTTAGNIKNSAVDLSAGAVSSNLYKVAGILREASMRSFDKTYLYQVAELQLGQFNTEVTEGAGKDINRARSTTPEQNTGI